MEYVIEIIENHRQYKRLMQSGDVEGILILSYDINEIILLEGIEVVAAYLGADLLIESLVPLDVTMYTVHYEDTTFKQYVEVKKK